MYKNLVPNDEALLKISIYTMKQLCKLAHDTVHVSTLKQLTQRAEELQKEAKRIKEEKEEYGVDGWTPTEKELQDWKSTKKADLSQCKARDLPDVIFTELPEIETLELCNNRLQQIPSQLPKLVSLTSVNFQANRLTGEVNLSGNLPNLKIIKFHGNKITSICSSSFFQHIPMLTELVLSFNSLPTIPPEISICANLESVDFSHNQITNLPDVFSGMKNLRSFSASNNQLSELPASLCGLENLNRVFVFSNRISKIPPVSWKSPNLVNLEENSLTSIPFGLSRAHRLVVSKNPLTEQAKKEFHGEFSSEEKTARQEKKCTNYWTLCFL